MTEPSKKPWLNEDWLAVWIALVLIALATIGVLGKNGINIVF